MDAADIGKALVPCRWDFCARVFESFAEWEVHFAMDHIAFTRPIDLTGRKRRKRCDGSWSLVDDDDTRATVNLSIIEQNSQTTGDITTTTHTLSFPMPPSFQSIPDHLGSLPIGSNPFLQTPDLEPVRSPGFSLLVQDGESATEDDDGQYYKGIYQSFINSPSPPPGQSGSGSVGDTASTGARGPPPSQMQRTPPWSQSPSPSIHNASNPTPEMSRSILGKPVRPPPPLFDLSTETYSKPATQVTPGHSITSSWPASAGPRPEVAGSPLNGPTPMSLRFGAALEAGDDALPFREKDRAMGTKTPSVGFSWGGS
ncbi:hypothetical protein IAU60_001825 [Kwoniella sp. DSM 27419]